MQLDRILQNMCKTGLWLILLSGVMIMTTGNVSAIDLADTTGWYAWEAKSLNEDGELGMSNWMEKPAGKHGRPEMVADKLIYNGKELKFWGLNNSYGACAPDKELADKRAAWYAKYGINVVRLHKYADGDKWAGILTGDSFVEFKPEELDEMDYFVAKMKEHGIYTKLSPTFGVKIYSKDYARVPYATEFTGGSKKDRARMPYGAVYFGKEIQDLQIEQTIKILKHKNPYTGLSYAQDPAIITVELFNEDSVLWNLAGYVFTKSPTLRDRMAKAFSEMLMEKYGSEEAWQKAWGQEAINNFTEEGFTNESISKGTVVPFGNPWLYSSSTEEGGRNAHLRQRMLDTMLFLYKQQDDFYQRFTKAIRQTGYDGPIVASNWQAGSNISHYYNLYSDAQIGIVDRHNYFGGAKRGRMRGKFENSSMLPSPGGAFLSSGMQQVGDRPFMLSEWIHVQPNEWGVEGPTLIGAYGMGLNGWDVSFMFQNGDNGRYSDALLQHAWDVTVPKVIGIFPAVARAIYRDDIVESPVLAPRYVHFDSLAEGKLGFRDTVEQGFDDKLLTSDKVPALALAAARCVVEFVDSYKETPEFPLEKYRKDEAIVSSTGQLSWMPGDNPLSGYVTIDTKGTQALIGFAQGKRLELGRAVFQLNSHYGAVYLTAANHSATLDNDEKVILTAIARCRNTGMDLGPENTEVVEKGRGPILMEPVKASITLKRSGVKRVELLDHDGLRTGKTLPVQDGTFTIDGERDKTPYYLIEY